MVVGAGSGSVMSVDIRMFSRVGTTSTGVHLLLRRRSQSQDGISGGSVGHEQESVRRRRALFVERVAGPKTLRFVLVRCKPGQAFFQMHVGFRHTGLFRGETNEAGGVAVAFRFERSAITALPVADQRRHAPSAVGPLL